MHGMFAHVIIIVWGSHGKAFAEQYIFSNFLELMLGNNSVYTTN